MTNNQRSLRTNTTNFNLFRCMKQEKLAQINDKIRPGIQAIGAFIVEQLDQILEDIIETKSLNSLVSYVDKEAEKKLVQLLSTALPEAGFLTEENTIAISEKETRWIIDPLDGTTNFLHRLPFFSISVALEHKNEIILGVVYECNRKEYFSAWKNGGAHLNDKTIQVSQHTRLADCLLATGFPYFNFSALDHYLKILAIFIKSTRGIRRLGSAALDLAYVACGRFDGFFENNLNPWDVAAGVILVKEAGGKITDYSNQDKAKNGVEILAGNNVIHSLMLNILNG